MKIGSINWKVLYDSNTAARKLNIIDLCEKDFYPPPGPDKLDAEELQARAAKLGITAVAPN
jgi:hypothetical protein